MLIGLCAVCCGTLLMTGCNRQSSEAPALTPVARLDVPALSAPLTEAELATFLAVVADMPDQSVPEFTPLAQAELDERVPARRLEAAIRREYGRMFDPVEQGSRWRSQPSLMQVFAAHTVSPEQFAAIVTRMSCGIAANTIEESLDVVDLADRAEQELERLVAELEALDSGAPLRPGSGDRTSVRDDLVARLKEMVALTEFGRLLRGVPPESRDLLSQHHEELAALLPMAIRPDQFERTLESRPVVVPVGFEQPAQDPRNR
jgi:hypothetical protein